MVAFATVVHRKESTKSKLIQRFVYLRILVYVRHRDERDVSLVCRVVLCRDHLHRVCMTFRGARRFICISGFPTVALSEEDLAAGLEL